MDEVQCKDTTTEPIQKKIKLCEFTNNRNEENMQKDNNETNVTEMIEKQFENSTSSIDCKANSDSEVTINIDNNENDKSTEPPMSKNKKKKLLKLQQWEIKKVEKRKQEREKLKKKKEQARENGVPYKTGPTRKCLKHMKMSQSPCKVTVVIDLSFDHLMIDKDIAKVVKQLLRVYTLNRRATNPIQLAFTSLKNGGKMHAAISKHDGYQNWDVRIEEKSFQDIYPQSKICYLTSESDNVLTALDPDMVYIIGGLVDHNSHKGLCFNNAKEMKLNHAQLPLDKLLEMKTRRVLTIDHVFEILLRVTEGKSWTESFLQVLPLRKGAKPVVPKNKDEILESINE